MNRKKEKRGRRSPCGPRPRGEVILQEAGQEETSAVNVSGQHYCRDGGEWAREQSRALLCAREQEWDLVKRCDQPGKVLIQLESLILAQSERWRQA